MMFLFLMLLKTKKASLTNYVGYLKYGFKVWYDALSIEWGDSLRAKIDAGLRKSRFGIVVISRHYIRKGWTQYELDGLFQKEMTSGRLFFLFGMTLQNKKCKILVQHLPVKSTKYSIINC